MVELSGVGQRGERRGNEASPSEGGVQSRQKLTPEHATKDAFGQEKVVGADDPVALVQRRPTPRHDAMDVRMEVEFLSPSVERHERADFGPQCLDKRRVQSGFPRQPASAGHKLCGDYEGRSGRDHWEA